MKKQKHDDKPQFSTSRRLVAYAVHRFLVMLDERMHGEKQSDDASYFRMPDGRHFDELVVQLQKLVLEDSNILHVQAAGLLEGDQLLESLEAVRSLMGKGEARALDERAARRLKAADKLRPVTRTERRYAVKGIDPKVARESGE